MGYIEDSLSGTNKNKQNESYTNTDNNQANTLSVQGTQG